MSQNAGRIDKSGNDVRRAGPGEMIMDQKKRVAVAGASQTLLAEHILAGIVVRSGPGAGYGDTWPSADSILAACSDLDAGDSFEFLLDNSAIAFANTTVAGAGITLVNGVVTASLVKRFLVTCIAGGRTQILQGLLTNGGFTINLQTPGVSASAAAKLAQSIQPGMLVTGTGVGAAAVVTGVNSVTGVVTVSVASTATQQSGVTFTPSIEIRGLYQAAA